MRDRAHDDAMAEAYREDPALAVEVLNSILEDGEQGELMIVLRQMAKAFGGVQTVAEQAQLNPTQLYRTLSASGNPALSSLSAILKAMGLQLAFVRRADPYKLGSRVLTASCSPMALRMADKLLSAGLPLADRVR